MATPSYATDLQDVSTADTTTGWAEASGRTTGGAATAEDRAYIQGNGAISQSTGTATAQTAGLQYTSGGITLATDEVFTFWQYFQAPKAIATWANGGMMVGVGSSAGNIKYWRAQGSDFGRLPYGGFMNVAVDPTLTADQTQGTPTGTYVVFVSAPNMVTAVSKGNPHVVDAIRYGRCSILATLGDATTPATFIGMAEANDADTARWGVLQEQAGTYLWKGQLSFGSASTAVYFKDSNRVITIDDTPRVYASFNKWLSAHTNNYINLDAITVLGKSLSITGSAPVSRGTFDFALGTTYFSNCNFIDLGTFVFNGTSYISDTIFRRCDTVTANGATFTACTFVNSYAATSASAVTLLPFDGCTFISDGSNHAVTISSIGTGTMNWNSSASGYATGSTGSPVTPTNTGNETIYVNATSGTLTINVASGAAIPSIRSAGATVNVVAGQVTTSVTVKDIDTGLPIEGARVYVYAAAGGNLAEGTVIIDKQLTDSNGYVEDIRSFSGNQPVVGRVRKASSYPYYKTAPVVGTISAANGLDLTIQLIKDV